MKEVLRTKNDEVCLIIDDEVQDRARVDEVRRCLLVSGGTDLFSTDVACYVVELDDRIWVVPEGTPGLAKSLFGVWNEALERVGSFEEAVIERLPRAWCRPRWLGLGRGLEPKLGVHGLETLRMASESWVQKPGRWADLPRPTEEGGSP